MRTIARHLTPSACSTTTTPSSGTRATTSSLASSAGVRATPRGWRCRSCSRCATTSTRADACSTRASRPGSSTPRLSASSSMTRSGTASAAPMRAARCLALFGSGDSQGDPIEYMFGARDHDPRRRQRSRDRGAVRRQRDRHAARRPRLGVQRRRQRSEPGQQLVVHRDRRLPQGDRSGGQLPAVRELGRRRVSEWALGSVRSAHRAVVSCGRGSRRRDVQAPYACVHGPARWRDDVVLDGATTSSSSSTT